MRWLQRAAGMPAIPEVSVNELAADLAAGRDVQVIDVREQDEWRSGHIPVARHIPLGDLGQRLSELDEQRPVVVVCRSGNRSAIATSALLKAGFMDVRNLDSGMLGWVRAGHVVER
jgi:rhodanese-related sulfurtransferase